MTCLQFLVSRKGNKTRTRPPTWGSGRLPLLCSIQLLAIGGLLLCLAQLQNEQGDAAAWVTHTLEVLGRVASLETSIQTTISAQRGYVIGRDPADQERSEAAEQQAYEDLSDLRRLLGDNPLQQQALETLDVTIRGRIEKLRRIASEVMALEQGVTPDLSKLLEAKQSESELTRQFDAINLEEKRLLALRQAAVARINVWLMSALLVCGLAVTGAIALMLATFSGRRREERHLRQIEQMNADLEIKITERTQSLHASESKFRTYFEHSRSGIVVYQRHPDGRIVIAAVNSAYLSLRQQTRDRVVGRAITDIWPEDEAAFTAALVDKCLRTRQAEAFSVQRHTGKEMRWLDVTLAPVLEDSEESGDEVIIADVHDVTHERTLAKQLLDQTQAKLEAAQREAAIFEHSMDVMTVIRVDQPDGDARLSYEAISPSFETVTGHCVADFLGKLPASWMPPDAAETIDNVYRQCITTNEQRSWTASLDAGAGLRDFEGIVTPVFNHDLGRVTRLVETVQDMTERNRLLSVSQHSQRIEAIGRIAAGVAHDFNNILQVVIGGLEEIIDELQDKPKALELAALALAASVRGAKLTGHLLSYARKDVLKPAGITPVAFLKEMSAVLRRVLPGNIEVIVEVQPDTPSFVADAALLETALLNLAINAGQAMPNGGTLRLEGTVGIKGNDPVIVISVSDTGIGMDEATIARATEPFFSTKGVDGSGLGLSMAHGFAEQSGGELLITSTPGLGTRVELRLPCAQLVEPGSQAPVPLHKKLSRGEILLVADAQDVLVTLGAFLIRAGFEATRAINGAEALALLVAGEHYDAMICDFSMPGSNGVDVIMASRRLRPGLPALMITGYANNAQIAALPKDVQVLIKPIPRATLINTLHEVINSPAPEHQLWMAS